MKTLRILLFSLLLFPVYARAQFTQTAVSCTYGNHTERSCSVETLLKFFTHFGANGPGVSGYPWDADGNNSVDVQDLLIWIQGYGNSIEFDLDRVQITDTFSGEMLGVYPDSLQFGDQWVTDMNGQVLEAIPVRILYTIGDEECDYGDLPECFPNLYTFRLLSMLDNELLNFELEFVRP